MGAIILKSKIKINNLDALNNKDCYAIIELRKFDALSYTGLAVYKKVIEEEDDDGNIIENLVIDIKDPIAFKKEEVDYLFSQINLSIPAGGEYDNPNRAIIASAFKYKIANNGAYGLSAQDWEIISE